MMLPKVETLLNKMEGELKHYLEQKQIQQIHMVGVQTGGVWLAQQLHQRLNLDSPLGTLNISFYRDDFSQKGLHPTVAPSQLPFGVEGNHIVLVDDVIMSGRTVRAGLNEIFDFGRPASITLAALIELDARELPIRADVVGDNLQLPKGQRIKLLGPENLRLELQDAG